MFNKYFLCPDCNECSEPAYTTFVCELASIPLLWRDMDFSGYLWGLEKCPSCGKKLPISFRDNKGRSNTLTHILENFAVDATAIRDNSSIAFTTNRPASTCYSVGSLRSEAPWDIFLWIALASASGVIGGLSFELIKNAILLARKTILKERKQSLEEIKKRSHDIEHLDRSTITISMLHEALEDARRNHIESGHSITSYINTKDIDVTYYIACQYVDKLAEKRIQQWEDMEDDELIQYIKLVHQYASNRLGDVHVTGQSDDKTDNASSE